MTPILLGRWQTRFALTLLIGFPITIIFGMTIHNLTTPLLILLYVLLVGLLLDGAYQWLQKRRWDHDWPPLLHALTGIIEGAIVFAAIRLAMLPGVPSSLSSSLFLSHYSAVWLATFVIVWGPMKVFFPWWRFKGGRISSGRR